MRPVIVFRGPSISSARARARIDAELRGPAAQGDVYLAAKSRPAAIALIDGVFDQRLAVSHKEILWALAEGVPVYGAASMGALRATELEAFGMRGVGGIFEDYRTGRLRGDDEVALAHGPAEVDHAPLTVTMVDLRATLDAACAAGALSPSEAAEVAALAHDVHYSERTWARVLELSQAVLRDTSALEIEVRERPVNRKLADAEALLDRLAAGPIEPLAERAWRFEPTGAWQDILRRAEARAQVSVGGAQRRELLEEVRLCPDAERLAAEAWRRALAQVGLPSAPPREDEVARASARFRRSRGLLEPEAFMRYLRRQGIADPAAWFADEARAARALRRAAPLLDEALIAAAQASGQYDGLVARAASKWAALRARGLEQPGQDERDLSRAALLGAYFHRLGRRQVPDPLEPFLEVLGFADERDLLDALRRERAWSAAARSAPRTDPAPPR